eukprot:scaffold114230_cov54-Phaeocystis_antarctica.AAC.1
MTLTYDSKSVSSYLVLVVGLVVPVEPLPVPPEGQRAKGVGVLLPKRAVPDEVVNGGSAAEGGPG